MRGTSRRRRSNRTRRWPGSSSRRPGARGRGTRSRQRRRRPSAPPTVPLAAREGPPTGRGSLRCLVDRPPATGGPADRGRRAARRRPRAARQLSPPPGLDRTRGRDLDEGDQHACHRRGRLRRVAPRRSLELLALAAEGASPRQRPSKRTSPSWRRRSTSGTTSTTHSSSGCSSGSRVTLRATRVRHRRDPRSACDRRGRVRRRRPDACGRTRRLLRRRRRGRTAVPHPNVPAHARSGRSDAWPSPAHGLRSQRRSRGAGRRRTRPPRRRCGWPRTRVSAN